MAIIADAYNSLFDTLFSIVFLIGLYFAEQPPDSAHPLGHSRIKPLIGMFIAFAIFLGGIQIILEAISRLMEGVQITFNLIMFFALFFSIIAKGLMYYFLKKESEQAGSPPIRAAAKDSLADMLASSFAIIGVFAGQYLWMFDPLMGLLISGWIFKTGIETAKENIDYIIGATPSSELKEKIKEIILQFPEVKKVHDMLAFYSGPRVHVRIHIGVDETLSLPKAHALEEEIEKTLLDLKEVDRVFLHLDPIK